MLGLLGCQVDASQARDHPAVHRRWTERANAICNIFAVPQFRPRGKAIDYDKVTGQSVHERSHLITRPQDAGVRMRQDFIYFTHPLVQVSDERRYEQGAESFWRLAQRGRKSVLTQTPTNAPSRVRQKWSKRHGAMGR